jgi:hypothetical protein
MKKTISLLIVIFFVFSLVVFGVIGSVANAENSANLTGTSSLEKIPSPDHIKYFNVLKKIGNALFGVRKATSTPDIATSTLEKIGHPGLINQFEKIKKIGNALWGIRKKIAWAPIGSEISACVATAIDVKDKALIARVTAAAVELNAALSTRSTCQQTALTATSTQRDILNGCVKTFNEAHKAIKEASKKVQQESWNTYKISLKACQTIASSTSAVPMIEDGGNIF